MLILSIFKSSFTMDKLLFKNHICLEKSSFLEVTFD
jgi:hypothetical protein